MLELRLQFCLFPFYFFHRTTVEVLSWRYIDTPPTTIDGRHEFFYSTEIFGQPSFSDQRRKKPKMVTNFSPFSFLFLSYGIVFCEILSIRILIK